MKYLLRLCLFLLLFSCATLPQYSKVKITPVFEKENIGVRALEIHHDKVYFAGRDGWIGIFDIEQDSLQINQWENHEYRAIGVSDVIMLGGGIEKDSMIFLINIGSPAYLFTGRDIFNLKRQLISDHPKAFFDALVVDYTTSGIAIGDPIGSCMTFLSFDPNSNSISDCSRFPKSYPDEAAFAASNTNIKMMENNIWVASGGKKSRIYASDDYGRNWQVYETPIVQGKETTGIYSMDFYDKKKGIAIGGDYTKPNDNLNNLIKTTNGGKTWKILNHPSHPGYRSCIQFVPKSKAKIIVAVGFKGMDISHDGGETWQHISDQSVYTIRFLNEKIAFAAGKNGIYQLEFYQ